MRVKQPVMCFECGKRVTLTKAGNFKKHSNPKTGDTCVRYGLPPKKPSNTPTAGKRETYKSVTYVTRSRLRFCDRSG